MPETAIPAHPGAAAPVRVLWLPGAYHSHRDFIDAGFAEAVRSRGLDIDLVFVDLAMNHVGDRSLIGRLRSGHVAAARAAGRRLWLCGISLGGLFALDYADSHPGELDGLCLLAPYLGNRMLSAEIAASGGLAAWRPGELAEGDTERRIWRYVQARGQPWGAGGGSARGAATRLHFAYGRDDRFAAAHSLMAAALPADCVDVIDGGHEWSTWRRLWERFLDLRMNAGSRA
ncbi:MAG TPA: alpha/beta hydrolase [Steroidobacteraceae bacterium]|nr:alpha/beta hydrolase [Steroidobacteraceae bacterium]